MPASAESRPPRCIHASHMSLPIFGCTKSVFEGLSTDYPCTTCDQYSGVPRGLGDRLASFIDKIASFKPKKCGCGKRRAALNRRFPSGNSSNR